MSEKRHIEIAQLFQQLEKDFPEELSAYKNLSRVLEQDGAIDKKTKDLILVALASATRCNKCIAVHIRNSVMNGASKQEILEAAMLNVLFRGGSGIMDMHVVYEELYNHFD
ncbi:MAG: carboxymuconolactone decarboxylase family protein [Desulfobacteraceae bacterium]|nr:carboxymuconolactone decarboxylase family protein [Desulfobacteraceae bacterium]